MVARYLGVSNPGLQSQKIESSKENYAQEYATLRQSGFMSSIFSAQIKCAARSQPLADQYNNPYTSSLVLTKLGIATVYWLYLRSLHHYMHTSRKIWIFFLLFLK